MAPDSPRQTSYWMDSTERTAHPPLTTDLEVDVAVVGGGIAGLCTAWELARAGRRVAVLEAQRIAAGVTGHTTAKLSALHGMVYQRLRRVRGAESAALYARSQQDAIDHVARVCAELEIDAELERVAGYTYLESAERVGEITDEARAAGEAGLEASFVTETDLPYPIAGAVRVERQAQFHPRKYLLALAGDLISRGGVIHERTRVVSLREGTPCRLLTEGGATVTAQDVVVATHYPVFDRALLFTRLEPHRELVVAAVIPTRDAPSGVYLSPEHNTRSVRTAPYDPEQRLLIITGEKFLPGTADVEERFARLASWTAERFPTADLAYRWAAQDNDSTDRIPYVGPFHLGAEHVYVATGFGGWGMASGVMAGRLLAARITAASDERLPAWAQLYDPRRLPALRETSTLFTVQATVARHFVGDRLPTSGVDSVADIPPGGGAVVRLNGKRCAVHREESGVLRAVSARCTHLGCVVRFNNAERTWDCPCHGSRFGTDGSVLQGPALHPLATRNAPESERAPVGSEPHSPPTGT